MSLCVRRRRLGKSHRLSEGRLEGSERGERDVREWE